MNAPERLPVFPSNEPRSRVSGRRTRSSPGPDVQMMNLDGRDVGMLGMGMIEVEAGTSLFTSQ